MSQRLPHIPDAHIIHRGGSCEELLACALIGAAHEMIWEQLSFNSMLAFKLFEIFLPFREILFGFGHLLWLMIQNYVNFAVST
jgi:hypothetical protein